MLIPEQLRRIASILLERYPDCHLVRNGIGNLAIMCNGQYVGYVDLSTGDVTFFDRD